MNKTFLYIVKRDKKKVELILIFNNQETIRLSKVDNLSSLGFDNRTNQLIQKTIGDRLLNHDIWVESQPDTNSLIASMRKRGIQNVPCVLQPTLDIGRRIGGFKSKPTMLRKSN